MKTPKSTRRIHDIMKPPKHKVILFFSVFLFRFSAGSLFDPISKSLSIKGFGDEMNQVDLEENYQHNVAEYIAQQKMMGDMKNLIKLNSEIEHLVMNLEDELRMLMFDEEEDHADRLHLSEDMSKTMDTWFDY